MSNKKVFKFHGSEVENIIIRYLVRQHDKPGIALQTCISDDLGKVNKEQTSYDDLLDAFRLGLKAINLVKKETQNRLVNPNQRTFREPNSSIGIPNFLIYDLSLKP